MQRTLELTIRLNDDDFELDIYEPETGEVDQIQLPYSPDEHPEFDEKIGNAVYSWLTMWAEEHDKIDEVCDQTV